MRQIGIYSFYDKKAETYDTPFWAKSDLFAERHFKIMLKNKDSMIATFIKDFKLDRIGTFDVLTGLIIQDVCTIVEGSQINTEEEE